MAGSDFRDAMARHAAGVSVVSARQSGGFRGLTATSFTSASLEPPLVLVCLDRFAQTRDAVADAGEFNVSVLARDQEFLAERFSARAPLVDLSWREVPHRLGGNGLPIVEGAVAWFECRLQEMRTAGDHDVALGLVIDSGWAPGDPLILWDRAFWRLS